MQTRTRNAVAVGVAAALAAAGLSAVARHKKTYAPGDHALDAIPSGALLVAVADVAALRSSPVGAPFLREGREIPGLGKVRDVCGFDPLDALTEVGIAIPAAGDEGEFGLVGSGPVDDDALIACASRVIEARGGRPTVTSIGSFRSVHDALNLTTGGELAVKKGGPLLLGAGTYLRSMIDAADRRAPTIRGSRVHGMLDRELGHAVLRVTVVLSPEQRRALAQELESAGVADSPARSIVAGGLTLRLGAAVALHAVVSCDDPAACGRLAETLATARDQRAARMVALGPLLQKISIAEEGELLHARTQIPAEQVATLLEQLLALRGARRPPVAPRVPAPAPDEVIAPPPSASSAAPR